MKLIQYLPFNDPLLQRIRENPKIRKSYSKGWYITAYASTDSSDHRVGIYYLQHNGTVTLGVNDGYWPTKETAEAFWEQWRIDVLLLKGAPYETPRKIKCV